MVDFDSKEMLGANKEHIISVLILQYRDEVTQYIESYKIAEIENRSNQDTLFYKLVIKIQTLELHLRETLKRKLPKTKDFNKFHYEQLKTRIDEMKDLKDVIFVFDKINEVLDQLKITRIDVRPSIDYTNLEQANKSKGL